MAVAFPSIKPSERSYKPPAHPVSRVRSQSGVTSARLWGSAPSNAELSLSFRHIHTDRATEIVSAWLASKSGIDNLILPETLFSGVGQQLRTFMQSGGATLYWTFAEAPTVTSVGPIWATVDVRLVGELRLN